MIQQNRYLFHLQTKIFKKWYIKKLLSDFTPSTQLLSGSLFSARVLELHRCEHFGEDGFCDTAGIYFRGSIFPPSAGEASWLSDPRLAVIRSGLWAETANSPLAAGALPQTDKSANISKINWKTTAMSVLPLWMCSCFCLPLLCFWVNCLH